MEWCRLTAPLELGSTGFEVKVLQEWLNLHGYALPVTEIFGSATASALSDYCFDRGLPLTGRVDAVLFEALQAPLRAALRGAREDALTVARRQLGNGARDVGAPWRGPWARLYLDGREGVPWAAAFVAYCARAVPSAPSPALRVGEVFVTADGATGLVASIHGDAFESIEVVSGPSGSRVAALNRRLSDALVRR